MKPSERIYKKILEAKNEAALHGSTLSEIAQILDEQHKLLEEIRSLLNV